MKQSTYETIIEVLTEKLTLAEWQLERSEEKIKELKAENEKLRSEK